MTQEQTHFGTESIPLTDKQARVNDVFKKVAPQYDLMNDLMSLGLHRCWKSHLITKLHVPKNRPFTHLDVAGGTGDIAFLIQDAGGPQTNVTVLDINPHMLGEGRRRAEKRNNTTSPALNFIEGNAEELPLPENAYDAYTIAFGIRNVPRIEAALKEAHRILKRGGHFLCLEFSHVDAPILDRIYDAYSYGLIPALGDWVAGDRPAYQYLVDSIRKFPPPETFSAMIEKAGFKRVSYERLTGGIVALHSGWKV